MTETTFGTCGECGRPRKAGAIFCECGALLDYSVTAPTQRTNGKSHSDAVATNGDAVAANGDAAAARSPTELEWPPGPFQGLTEPAGAPTGRSIRVVRCPNEKCKVLNPTTFLLCWRCETPLVQGVEAGESWSLRRALHLEKRPPLAAGERARPSEPFGRDPRKLLQAAAIVLAAVLLIAVAVIAVIKLAHPAAHAAAHWYGTGRKALLPRFSPVNPSAVRPSRFERVRVRPKVAKRARSTSASRAGAKPARKFRRIAIAHPAADAFDRNLSTYWQTRTPREVPDQLSAIFKPAAEQIDDVAVFAGDPTGATIVPQSLQLTFFRWEPHPSRWKPHCSSTEAPKKEWKKGKEKGTYCVIEAGKGHKLENTPSEQRFATGLQRDVSKVVVTVTGTHRADNKKAKAALTDIEFFDKR